MLHFELDECLVAPMRVIETRVVRAIYEYHIAPQSAVRENLGAPVYCSEHSCYRPKIWEMAKGRMPRSMGGTRERWSQHTFQTGSKGAFDGRTDDMRRYAELLIKLTSYTRLAYYPQKGFIHCDYAAGNLRYFINTPDGWQEQDNRKAFLGAI